MNEATKASFSNNPLDDNRNYYAQDKPWPIALKWGVIGALVFLGFTFASYLMGDMSPEKMEEAMSGGGTFMGSITSMLLGFVGWIAYTIIYYKAIEQYRSELGGSISFGKGFKVAFYSVLVKAAGVLLFAFLFYQFVAADFLDAMLDGMAQVMSEASQGDEDMLEMMMSIYENIFSPIGMAISSAFSTIFGGTLLSLIAAAIAQKD